MAKFLAQVEVSFKEVYGEQRAQHSEYVTVNARNERAAEQIARAWAENEFEDVDWAFAYGLIDITNARSIGFTK